MRSGNYSILYIAVYVCLMLFTASQYIECDDLGPDEVFDLAGVLSNQTNSMKATAPTNSSDPPYPEGTLDACSVQRQPFGENCLQLFTLELVSSVVLRC